LLLIICFLWREAHAYRGLCHGKMSVRPSMCHTPVFCLNGYILKGFSPSGSPTILVFRHQTAWQYSDSDPP